MFKGNRINPRRCAYGGAQVAPGATNFAFVSLVNNSQYAEFLIIHDWFINQSNATACTLGVQQAVIAGGASEPIFPFFPNEAPPPGVLTSGGIAAALATGYTIYTNANTGVQWNHDIPFTLIPAGWTFYLCSQTVNTLIRWGVWYEAVKPEHLDPGPWAEANLTAALLNQ